MVVDKRRWWQLVEMKEEKFGSLKGPIVDVSIRVYESAITAAGW